MKSASLPLSVHPRKLAHSGGLIEGNIKISLMVNLCEALSRDEGQLDVSLCARIDEQHRVFLKGKVKGSIWMDCQLCMAPISVEINQNFELLLVITEEQAENALKQHEPLLVETDDVEVVALIEQEVMLALPLAPAHDKSQACLQHESFEAESTLYEKIEEPQTKMPFTHLKALLLGDKPK